MLRIIYVGNNHTRLDSIWKENGDLIILTPDGWDDYNFKTTFKTRCRIAGNWVLLGTLQILIQNETTSSSYLDNLLAEGWDGVFPIPNTNYISTPSALTFYEQIDGNSDHVTTINVAKALKDASFMVWISENPDSVLLTKTAGFSRSLQRERGAIKAYADGWKFFNNAGINVGNLVFKFKDAVGETQTLNLNFESNSLLPHDINVLIGPNGVGKSQLLIQIVEHWLDLNPDSENEMGFVTSPNINQVVIVSYSPFERFAVDVDDVRNPSGPRQDRGVYHYFGLRGRRTVYDKEGNSSVKIRLSQTIPKSNAANSLLACLVDDQEYGAIKGWSAKVKTMQRVLRTAIDFDYAALVVRNFENEEIFFKDMNRVGDDPLVRLQGEVSGNMVVHIPISNDRIKGLKAEEIRQHLHAGAGVVFLKNGESVQLSSGQRLFSYIVINILGAIRRNSLILIDEPELFLHPTLEIAFIAMLKDILESYHSKALLATHSLETVRELPRDCVHVFDKTDDGLFIKHPPFETFGGDIQRISSYVFGDKSISKPFEAWIKDKLEEYDSSDELITALGDEINEEMIIQINAMGAGKW